MKVADVVFRDDLYPRIETSPHKVATVTKNLAKRCNPILPAYCLLYTPSRKSCNPADPTCPDIAAFRVRRLWPEPETDWLDYTPEAWARRLLEIRKHSAANVDGMLEPKPQSMTPEELADEYKPPYFGGNGDA